ncbi:hypothetical protein KI387_016627, partial [Taxus chinensis]
MGGDPSLAVRYPKAARIGIKSTKASHIQRMGYIDDLKQVLRMCFQNTIPMEPLLAMSLFDEEGAYPQKRKMISWAFESHINEPEFKVSQGAIMRVPESK